MGFDTFKGKLEQEWVAGICEARRDIEELAPEMADKLREKERWDSEPLDEPGWRAALGAAFKIVEGDAPVRQGVAPIHPN